MSAATDGSLPNDIYGRPADGVYVPGTGPVAQQGSNLSLDAGGTPSASTVVNLGQIGASAVPAPGDATAFAGSMPSVRMEQTGTGVASPVRMATKFAQLKATAITAGTPVGVYTPTAGKKWRLLGYHLSLSVAGSILFEDTTGVEVLRTPLLVANAGQGSPAMGLGVQAALVTTALFLDVTASGNVSGWIAIEEE